MYYWGKPDASITFCEEKYTQSPYVAEYANTLSSLFYVMVSLPFIRTNIGKAIMFIGLGSIILHGTCRYYGQWLDEISMLALEFGAARQIWYPNLSILWFIPIMGIYLSYYSQFLVFFTMFSMGGIPLIRYIPPTSVAAFFMGFGFWVIDQLYCEYVREYAMHYWWHVWTSISLGIILVHNKNNGLLADA